MKVFFKFKSALAIYAIALGALVSCSDSDSDSGTDSWGGRDFQIAFASGSESNSATYVQGVNDLTKGEISPRIGRELESSRTARIFLSSDGATVYSLNYTVGTIEKLNYKGGGDKYDWAGGIDAAIPLGTKTVRLTKLNDEIASVHYIAATPEFDASGNVYLKHKMTASIGLLDLATMRMKDGYNKSINVEIDSELAAQGYYISRIDAPVISGSKLYYGAAVSKYNPSTGKGVATDRTFTLVIDYPTLTNATAISTTRVQGGTNGYRTPTQHKNESGEILQMVSGNNEVHIVKIKDGQYNESFDFNLSKLLNKSASSNGWFYVGNGIGYIPYEDLSKDKVQIGVNPDGEPTYSAMWKLARVDLNKGTAIDLDVPDNLWLTQYQSSVVKDGVFYIALSPVGTPGNIYMFNINSENPKGELGAKLVGTGADQYYIGIY